MTIFGVYPTQDKWNERRDWVEKQLLDRSESGSFLVSEHATTLFMDMQLAFCAGAWLSVVITSISVIDAQLRETEAANDSIGTAKLLNDYYKGEEINWLRQLRNKYVHHNIANPTNDTSNWYNNQNELEKHATKAMQMTIHAFFQSPGT
ncbi:MAG: hypothetical protein J0L80_02300 [Chitinophagales bacterium]|nr:hypothetical protein [Chitinophagales bacterium]